MIYTLFEHKNNQNQSNLIMLHIQIQQLLKMPDKIKQTIKLIIAVEK